MFRRRHLFFMITRIIIMFIIGLLVAIVVTISRIDMDILRGDLLLSLRSETGLPLEIDGEIFWKFSFSPNVEMSNVRVPNAAWAKNKDGVQIEKMILKLDLISLIQNKPRVLALTISDMVVNLEENAAGDYSIGGGESAPRDANAEKEKFPFNPTNIPFIEIKNALFNVSNTSYKLNGMRIERKTTNSSDEYSGFIKSEKKLYPFIVSFSEYNPTRKVYPIRAAMSTGGQALVADIALEGTSLAPIDFKINGDISNLYELGQVIDADFPTMPPLSVNISGGYADKKLTIRKSTIKARNQEVQVSGEINWANVISKISLNIQSKNINLPELFPDLYAKGQAWVRPDRPLHIFKDVNLYGKELLNHNIDLNVNVGNLIIYNKLIAQNLKFSASLKKAKIHTSIKTDIAGGHLRMAANADIEKNGKMNIVAAALSERIYLGEIMTNLGALDYISELPINIEFYLRGSGSDLSELISNTSGPIYIYSVARGYAHSKLVSKMYGTDFLTDLRHAIGNLFTSKKKDDQIKITCAAINIKVRAGAVQTTHGAAIETNAINVRVVGLADFGAEHLKMSLITVPVRGLKLSLTGSVVNSMEFVGNMAEPEMKISGAKIAGKVASATGIGLLLAPFTGGVGLAVGAGIGFFAGDLLENWLSDHNPCKTAMGPKGAPSVSGDAPWLNKPMSELVSTIIK